MVISVSAYLFVSPLACIYQSHNSNFTKFSIYTLPVAVAQSSSGSRAICYVFPVVWMTSCFHIMRRDDAYVSSSSPGGGTGGDVCCLLLHLVFLLIAIGMASGCTQNQNKMLNYFQASTVAPINFVLKLLTILYTRLTNRNKHRLCNV